LTPSLAIRTVPPSALAAGAVARNDVAFNPNVPSAGELGQSKAAISLAVAAWSDAERELLNTKGVDVIKELYGGFRIYGWRSLADPANDPDWIGLGNCRLYMTIANRADVIGERFVMKQFDGQFVMANQFGAALKAMLLDLWGLGALFGATPDESFIVDVGPTINTPITIANNELRAALAVKMSPFAELVTIEIVKLLTTEVV
jgi:phage tail sheath protein FI